MKQAIHPVYGPVVFRDRSAGTTFLTRSTIVGRLAQDHPRIEWPDGQSYPVVDVEISSASHPFWTGRGRVLDTEGRVEKFNRRYRAGQPADQAIDQAIDQATDRATGPAMRQEAR